VQAVRAEDAERRRSAAERLARELSVPADPAILRALASEADTFELGRRSLQEWEAARSRLAESWTSTAATLRDSLAGRGIPAGADLRAAYRQYEGACEERRSQAVEAAGRPGLEEALRQRVDREREAGELNLRRHDVLSRIREVAESCGVRGADEADYASGLDAWLDRRGEKLKRRDTEVRERAELGGLLAGGDLEALEGRADAYRRRAEHMTASFQGAELDTLELGEDPDVRLAELAARARDARQLADRAEGELETQAKLVPSVAAAEEELSRAEEELEAVRELARIVALTRRFLQDAQERVHRSIAPVLKRTLEAWLPGVTGGRYQEVIVTPETLQVRIRATNGEWRDADRLSQGTREQIYLLLRVALVEHLTRKDEVCPLILDDVTVQCDGARTVALLDLLHRISSERQVVLFSQEDDVRAWAEGHLDAACDRLIELDPRAVPA
jgi:DNA repair exonuclease SbcCD ATPase subunit